MVATPICSPVKGPILKGDYNAATSSTHSSVAVKGSDFKGDYNYLLYVSDEVLPVKGPDVKGADIE